MCIDIGVLYFTHIFFQCKNMADIVYTGDAYFRSHNLSEMPCVNYNTKLSKFEMTNIAPFTNSY